MISWGTVALQSIVTLRMYAITTVHQIEHVVVR